jgi:hypothetical protein
MPVKHTETQTRVFHQTHSHQAELNELLGNILNKREQFKKIAYWYSEQNLKYICICYIYI